MMPYAWFNKLKNMTKFTNTSKPKYTHPSTLSFSDGAINLSSKFSCQPHLSDKRKSYYFHSNSPTKNRILDKHQSAEPPRKSSTRRRRSTKRKRLISSAGCTTLKSMLSEFGPDRDLTSDTSDGMLSWSTSRRCRFIDKQPLLSATDQFDEDNGVPQMARLPPKLEPTKIQRTSAEFSEKNVYGSLSVKVVQEDLILNDATWNSKDQHMKTNIVRRRSPVKSSSPGVRLRMNSPRIAHRRIQGRKNVSQSFAVVKWSEDPSKDFRDSMVEMIVENNIWASKDLEQLLVSYLSLNSVEYHDLIINVFKQIWFDFIHLGFN